MNERELLVLAYHIARQIGNGDIDVALDTATKVKLKEVREHKQVCQYIVTRVLGAIKTAKRRRHVSISVYEIPEPSAPDPKPEFEILDGLTETEIAVARSVIRGDTNAEICKKLHLSAHELKSVRQNLKEKLRDSP